jgi:hypothetical protein
MANIFTITTTTQALKADANGVAIAVFTVTNVTSRPVRGFVKPKPLGNTKDEWLKIEGETERDFPAGATHQFTVVFNKPKPPATPPTPPPAESFPFRVDAISSINPNEDYTEGPVVTVETAAGQPLPVKKPFPWWILIVAGVLLVVGAIVAVLLLRGGNDPGNENAATPTPTATATATATATPTLTPSPTHTIPTPVRTRPKIVRMSPREYGTDRPGSDFNRFIAPTLEVCQNACRETENCKAFTFGVGNNCWLKNKIPPPVGNPNYISGFKIE